MKSHRRVMDASAAKLLVATCVVLGAAGAAWFRYQHHVASQFVRDSVLRVEELARQHQYLEAWQLSRKIDQADDRRLSRRTTPHPLLPDAAREPFSRIVTIESTPIGAEVSFQRLDAAPSDWIELGKAPFNPMRVPLGKYRWRATLDDHHDLVDIVDVAAAGGARFEMAAR